MIDRALEIEPIEEIENLQIKSYSYRTLARLEADKGDYNLAEEYVTKSSECVDAMSDPQENIDTVNMFNEILLAKIYLNQGFLDECEAILNQYDVDAIFTTESDNTIIIRNFVLPYYETKCTLQIARKKFTGFAHWKKGCNGFQMQRNLYHSNTHNSWTFNIQAATK